MYEGLIVTPAGGLPARAVARPHLEVDERQQDADAATSRKNVKWSDGTALTSADVVYSSRAARRQTKAMDIIGFTRPGTNIVSITARGKYSVVIKLKTVDSQFVSATLNGAIVVPQHIWSKVADPATFTNPHPVGSGPFTTIARFTTQDYVFCARTRTTGRRASRRSAASSTCRRRRTTRAGADPERPGRLDAQLRPERREGVRREGPGALPRVLRDDRVPAVARVRHDAVPVQPRAVPQGALAGDRPASTVSKLGEYGYAPPTDAIGINWLFPQWVTDASVKAQAKALATYNPTAAKKMLTDAGFTYKGSQLIDPKGNAVKLDIHVISGWSDWVASDQIITKNLQAIGIDSNVEARARLELVVPERVEHEEPDAALAGRRPGLAVRLLQREPAQQRVHRFRAGRDEHRQLGALPERPGDGAARPVEGDARPEEAAGGRDAAREAVARSSCRSCRCSSGRAGRPTAPSTSIASTRRRTTSATRSSRRSPTTSSRSPASARAERPGSSRQRPSMRAAGGPSVARPPVYPPMTRAMRWFLRRLVFYVFAIWVALTLNFLLPRLMPGEPDRRRAPASVARADRVEPGDHPDVRGAARRRQGLDLARLRRSTSPRRAPRLRHLDLQLPGAGLRGDRPHAAVLDLPRRRRVPALVRARDCDRDDRRLAPRRLVDNVVVPIFMALSAFPAFFTALLGVYFLGLQAALVPDPARL